MKKGSVLLLLTFFSLSLFSQTMPGQWTWLSGDSLTEQPAIFGTKGVADPSSKPFASAAGASWVDAAGNMWLFGGSYSTASGTYYLNDLWKYSFASGTWTWMSGDGTPNHPGVYGTKGVPDVANRPGGRQYFNYWVDAAGNFWIFGGIGYSSTNLGYLNDLWKYSPVTNQWTWVSGTPSAFLSATYGVQGAPDVNSMPGGRYGAASYIDDAGNLYIFGGLGDGGPDGFHVNNMWMYSPATGLWTWISGKGNFQSLATYGTQGVPSASNLPGGRLFCNGWKDKEGNFWLFGGRGSTSVYYETLLNDLWKFSPVTRQWTWISGDTLNTNFPGNRGTKGVSSPDTRPGGRDRSTSWTDGTGNFWLYGGSGFTSGPYGVSDELYMFNPTRQQWTWVSGGEVNDSRPVYGTKGVTAPSNSVGGRVLSIGATDAAGNLLLYGGAKSNGTGNDLWKYTLAGSVLPIKLNGFSAQKDQGSVILRWKTEQEQNSQQFIIERSADGLQYQRIGAVRAAGTSAGTLQYSYTDRNPLSGKNLYRLQQVDQDGKAVASPTAQVDFQVAAQTVELLGNPVRSMLGLRVQLLSQQGIQVEIRDLQGHLLQKVDRTGLAGSNDLSLPVSNLAKGTYVVRITINGENITKQFLKL